MKQVTLYTDGSCVNNGTETAVGGWTAILQFNDKEKLLRGFESHTTNNKMKLRAVIEGVRALKTPCEVKVFTNSDYVITGASNMRKFIADGWKNAAGKQIANKELWEELIKIGNEGKHHIQFQSAKDTDCPFNEVTEILAKATAKGI